MTARGTLMLAVILGALTGLYAYVESQGEAAEAARQEARRLFPGAEAEDVAQLTIERVGQDVIAAERDQAFGWRITKPYAIEASPQAWSRMANAAANMEAVRQIAPRDAAEVYGLGEPVMTLRIGLGEMGEGPGERIAFGAADPSGRYRYALRETGGVLLLDNAQYAEFDRRLLDVRNRYLAGTGQETVERVEYTRIRERSEEDPPASGDVPIELEGGVVQQTVVFERQDNGAWLQTEPNPGPARSDKVDAFVRTAQFATGTAYTDDPEALADYGLSPAGARITFHFAEEPGRGLPARTQTVYFGAATGEDGGQMYVKRADAPFVFTIDTAAVDAFPETPNAFRERRLLTHGIRGLQRMVFTLRDEAFELQLDESEKWMVVRNGQEERSDQGAVSAYISALLVVEGQSFAAEDRAKPAMANPRLTIALHYRGKDEPVHIRFGEQTAYSERYYVQQDTGEYLTLSAPMSAELMRGSWYFRSKQLLSAPPSRVQSIRVLHEGAEYLFRKAAGRWSVVEPEGMAWDSPGDLAIMLSAIEEVKAEAADSDTTPGSLDRYGLAEPVLQITAEVETSVGTETRGPLTVGGLAPDTGEVQQTRYAIVNGRDGLFRVEQTLVEDFREALRGVRPAEGAEPAIAGDG